jgi:hypothetical protein
MLEEHLAVQLLQDIGVERISGIQHWQRVLS